MTQTIIKIPPVSGSSFDPTDIEITDNTSGAFLVQDSSTEYIRIDTTTGNSRIQIDTGIANQAFSIKESREIQLRCGASNQFLLSGNNTIDAFAHTFNHRQFSGGKFRSLDAGGSEILRIDEDSNTTFTLDSTSSASFKIKDNAGTPRTFLDIDEGNTTAEIKIGGDGTESAGSIFTVFTGGTAPHYQIAAVKIQNGGATTATVDVDFQNAPHCTIYVTPTASSQIFTFNIKDGLSANNRSYMELPLRVINEGSAACTIKGQSANGTYSTIDHVGSSALDSSGFSLAAGDAAFFRIAKANKGRTTNVTANNVYVCETLAVT